MVVVLRYECTKCNWNVLDMVNFMLREIHLIFFLIFLTYQHSFTLLFLQPSSPIINLSWLKCCKVRADQSKASSHKWPHVLDFSEGCWKEPAESGRSVRTGLNGGMRYIINQGNSMRSWWEESLGPIAEAGAKAPVKAACELLVDCSVWVLPCCASVPS